MIERGNMAPLMSSRALRRFHQAAKGTCILEQEPHENVKALHLVTLSK
jgi:hypothetical protein